MQRVLEAEDAEERLSLALDLLSKEKELAKLQKEIQQQVESKMTKQQREYFLHQQLKSIKQELGIERDDKDELLREFYGKIAGIDGVVMNKDAKKVIDEEMKKFTTLEKNSPEFNVTRQYLDWLTSIPWGKRTEDRLNLKLAAEQLDHDHYGNESSMSSY